MATLASPLQALLQGRGRVRGSREGGKPARAVRECCTMTVRPRVRSKIWSLWGWCGYGGCHLGRTAPLPPLPTWSAGAWTRPRSTWLFHGPRPFLRAYLPPPARI